jgi:queuine/archaeosine tRNA-ribosyltransferase
VSLGYPLSILTVFLGLSSQQLVQEEALSPEIILSNTYHLALQPGEVKTIKNKRYSLHYDRIRHLTEHFTDT